MKQLYLLSINSASCPKIVYLHSIPSVINSDRRGGRERGRRKDEGVKLGVQHPRSLGLKLEHLVRIEESIAIYHCLLCHNVVR